MGADIDKVRSAPFGLVPWLLHAKINSLTDMPVPLGSSGDTAATAAAAETRAPLALLNDFVFTKDGTKISPIMGHAVFCFGANADAVALRAVVGGATTAVGSLGTFFFFFGDGLPVRSKPSVQQPCGQIFVSTLCIRFCSRHCTRYVGVRFYGVYVSYSATFRFEKHSALTLISVPWCVITRE